MDRFHVKTAVAMVASLAVLLAGAGSASAAAWPEAWSGQGTAAVTVTSDGTSTDPVFDYSVAGSGGAWKFSATAKTARRQQIVWRYKGYHAFFAVTVGLQQFVRHNGVINELPLAFKSAAKCCAAPSGGFDYSGQAEFDLQPGDQYGFLMTGANADRDRRLIGTLSLAPALSVISPGPQTAVEGTATSLTLSASGAIAPYTWSASGLPAGLAINPSTGVISGTPTTAGTSTVTVTATDAASLARSMATQTFKWTVAPPCQPAQLLGNPDFTAKGSQPRAWTAKLHASADFSVRDPSGQLEFGAGGYAFGINVPPGVPIQLTQEVTIPAGCTHSKLSFGLLIHGQLNPRPELLRVGVITAKGPAPASLLLDQFTPNNQPDKFQNHTYDIGSFAGRTVKIGFDYSGTDEDEETYFTLHHVWLLAS